MISRSNITFGFKVSACAALAALASVALSAQASTPSAGVAKTLEARCALLLDLSYPPSFTADPLIQAGLRAIEEDPGSPLNTDLARRVLVLAGRNDASPSVWPKIQNVAKLQGLHGLTRLALNDALARRFAIQRKKAERLAVSPHVEYVRSALAIGPFGDLNGDGFGLAHGPELAPIDLEVKSRGRYGREIAWRTVAAKKLSPQLNLRDSTRGAEKNGTHYALIQLESSELRSAYLQVTTTASFEAWWNGARIAAVHRAIETLPTRIFYPVVLRRGWNRLLVKCAQAGIASVACRPVDELGNPLLSKPSSNDQGKGGAATLRVESEATLHPIAPPPAEDLAAPGPFVDGRALLEQALSAGPEQGSATVRAALANLASRAGATDAGLAMARAALADAPGDARLLVAAMAAWRLARHVPPDVRRTEVRKLLSQCEKGVVAAHAWLFESKLDELRGDDQKETALRRVEERLAKHPMEIRSLEKKLQVLRSLRWLGAARRVHEILAAQAPQPFRYRRSLADAIAREGNPSKAMEIISEILTARPGDTALLDKAMSLAKDLDDAKRVDQLMETRFEEDPSSRTALSSKAALLVDRGDFAGATEILRKVSADHPEDAQLLQRIAKIEYRRALDDVAIKTAEQSLQIDEEQHELRHWIARIRKGARFTELQPWQLNVEDAITGYEANAADTSSPTTLVLDQMIIRVYPDGSQMEETHVLKRVNTASGVEANETSDAAAEADEVLELRTITPDRRSWMPHRVAGNFTMPRLAPGVFVEEHYRNFKSAPGMAPIDFVRFFFRGVARPYRFSRLVVLLPKREARRFKGEFILRNFPTAGFSRQQQGELEAFVFVREAQAPIQTEAAMPDVSEIAPWVTFGRSPEISPAIRSWKTQFAVLTKPYVELRAKAQELCKGLADQRSKAKAIHEFCHAHTPDVAQRGGSPQPVSILLKGEGPRFWLELALLRCAGISWTPAVIRPFAAGFDPDPKPAFASWDRWSARGALVKPDNMPPYWLILGAPRWQNFGETPSHIGGSPAAGCPYLLLEGDAGRPGLLDGAGLADLAEARVRCTVKLRGSDAIISADMSMPGRPGMLLKEQLRSRPSADRQLFAQRIAAYLFRGSVTFRKVEWIGLDERGQGLRARFDLIRRGALRERDGKRILPPIAPPRSYTRLLGGRDRRQYPYVIGALLIDDWEIRIDLGPLRFAQVPKGKLRKHEVLDWALSYELRDGELIIRRNATVRPGRIEPGEYQRFLTLCREIDNAESQPIVLLDPR